MRLCPFALGFALFLLLSLPVCQLFHFQLFTYGLQFTTNLIDLMLWLISMRFCLISVIVMSWIHKVDMEFSGILKEEHVEIPRVN